ncbi:hypothetical protein I552_7715 [Mycobacterium xenopi 3993]|nr:hypothetical protein I552_7715 [Mycobacterium xenopi 3993]
MTRNELDDERRSFASRTPVNENPDKVVYRRGFVTRHQVTGWRFVMRRIASGVALHDTRMLVDPLRTQSRAVLMGVLILVTGLIGCFVFSLIRPGGSAGTNPCWPTGHRRPVCAGRRPASPGPQPRVSPADRWSTGQPHHGEKH